MLNVKAPPFAATATGVKAYADPTLTEGFGWPEMVRVLSAVATGAAAGADGGAPLDSCPPPPHAASAIMISAPSATRRVASSVTKVKTLINATLSNRFNVR